MLRSQEAEAGGAISFQSILEADRPDRISEL